MWILGSYKKDLLIFHLSGFFVLFSYLLFKNDAFFTFIWSFIFFQIIDVGHNYITFWRTLFKKENNSFYWSVFGGCFLFISTWLFLGIPYYWTFALYFIVWHHIRQFYGINRWYQKLNNRFCKSSNYFLYLLTFGPFIVFHFRNFPPNPDINRQLFTYPQPTIFKLGLIICSLLFISWVLGEIRLYLKGEWELNRFLAIGIPATLHFYCFLFAKNYLSIFFPLLAVHGLSYLAIMSNSLFKLNPKRPVYFYLIFVTISIFLFGFGDYLYKENIIKKLFYYDQNDNLLYPFLLALTGTASLFHCLIDGFLWTNKNPDAKKIFQSSK